MSKVTAVLATVGAVALGYAVYFDYSRRHNADFRRKLRKSKKQQQKQVEEQASKAKQVKVNEVKELLTKSLEEDPIPTDAAAKEQYFMTQVTMGEQLAAVPGNEIKSALCFYRALAVYPNPTDILNVYQKSVPQEIYEYIIMMMAMEPPLSIASFLGGDSVQLDAEEQD
ncbi:CYFA0S12e02542g1_1 [Cyberlindnera fabianii]|uniref:Mitochondrial import receptor subunit TOM20 n=1 Tax=Cyberlindnera fabianii TaxID=36022 RepID=A0A061B1E3_CYBFA|nr:Mitochondrial import receptor subunit TOM20 [Cyberlindnera fabianii]CDR43610.1 CYFA0S12e02542g1_1 [Cyberlindnera fabianii]